MNTKSNALSLRGGSQHRDHRAHRRAHLDTYAQRRAQDSGLLPQQASVNLAQTVMQPRVVPQIATQSPPEVIAIPVQKPVHNQAMVEDYIRQQPAVTASAFVAGPVQSPTQVQIQPEPVRHSSPVAQQKSYLDTLTRRHIQAVAAAPAAEETVAVPTLSTATETLLEDPVKDERIAANLNALYSDSLTNMISANTKSASAAHVRTIVASAFACGVMAVGIFTFMGNYNTQPVVAQPIGAPVIEVEASAATPKEAPATTQDSNTRVGVNPDHPVRVVISSIGVNAPVEGLGTTPEGLIAVPKAYGVVGWYNKGVLPGQPGPAVLVGHYAGGNKAVFDNLKDLKDGDLITTTNGKGQSFTYRVTAKNEYEKDKVPMAQIFKKGSESRLEIITCSGKWQSNTYDKRLVVTAELVK